MNDFLTIDDVWANKVYGEVTRIDDKLYMAKHLDGDYKKAQAIWNSIKGKKEILEGATQLIRAGNRNMFLGNTITEQILADYPKFENYGAPETSYQSLVNKIYSDVDLARLGQDTSFLVYTLSNNGLDLTDKQKEFAIEEALRARSEHNIDEYDICYHILKNHNFADEIEQLVYNFYEDYKVFNKTVGQWEENITKFCDDKNNNGALTNLHELLFISDNAIGKILPPKQAKKVIGEIDFIKELRKIRPSELAKKPDPSEIQCRVDIKQTEFEFKDKDSRIFVENFYQ